MIKNKYYCLLLVVILLFSSCKNNTNNNLNKNSPLSEIELDTFNSRICQLNFPSNWHLDTCGMKSDMSPSIFKAKTNSLTSGFISLELLVIMDTNNFRDGVVSIIQSLNSLKDSVDLRYIKYRDKEFINVLVQHDSTLFSDNYFYKDRDYLYWYLFSGKKVDLFFCKPDIAVMIGSLKTKN